MSDRPIIGITTGNCEAHPNRYESAMAYGRAVAEAGGVPFLLPQESKLVQQYVRTCDGLIFTGGDDPTTEAFGQPTHPKARPIDPRRQAFELALLDAAAAQPDLPVLGICLGMQLMALYGGGRLTQYLPDTMGQEAAAAHQGDRRHELRLCVADSPLGETTDAQTVVSAHRQAVDDPGHLRIIATAPDQVIEAIDAPKRAFYLGVQWHPERGDQGPLSAGLFHLLVQAADRASSR